MLADDRHGGGDQAGDVTGIGRQDQGIALAGQLGEGIDVVIKPSDAALEQMRPGQLSQPIPVRDGVYIVFLRDKRSGAATSLVQMKQVMIELPETASEAAVAAATQRLEALRGGLTCDNIMSQARATAGVSWSATTSSNAVSARISQADDLSSRRNREDSRTPSNFSQ